METRSLRESLASANNTAKDHEQKALLLAGRIETKDETIASLTMNIRQALINNSIEYKKMSCPVIIMNHQASF